MTPMQRVSQPGGSPMTMRSFRIPDDLYAAAQAAAGARRDSLSEVVRRALVVYLEETMIGQ